VGNRIPDPSSQPESRPEGQADLLSAVERAGLILLVFPLYVDALSIVTKPAEMAAIGGRLAERSRQRVVAIVKQPAFRGAPEFGVRWLSAASSPPKAASRGPVVLPWAEEEPSVASLSPRQNARVRPSSV